MADSRDIVLRILRNWTVLNDPPYLPDRSDPDWAALAPRDRPFAFDLVTGILRWRNTLDAIIATRLKQPIDTLDMPIRAILWLGTYQLLFQGTADYAAVSTAVSLARRTNPAAAGLVNFVLRSITRLKPEKVASDKNLTATQRLSRRSLALDFENELRFNENIFPDPVKAPATHLAAVRSHPLPYVDHLRRIHAEKAGDLLLRNNQRPLITLRVDAAEVDVPATAGLAAHADAARFLVAMEGWSDIVEKLVEKGVLSPQDPTAAKPVRQAEKLVAAGTIGKPATVLDYCAGLGTKSIQLARAFPEAAITGTDIDVGKLERLKMRATQVKQANIVTKALGELREATFDLVLVDVPCSNTGVMGKRVQSRWRWPTLNHGELAALQEKLLKHGLGQVAANGVLVYSTCSIDPAENEQRIGKFLRENPGLKLVKDETTLPSLDVPKNGPHDGGYYAVMKRQ